MSSMDSEPNNSTISSSISKQQTAAGAISSKLSTQQKIMLERLVDKARKGPISTQQQWSKIASQLNQVPGARKTWMQWSQTWKDVKKNAKKSQLLHDSDKLADRDWSISDETVSDEMCISSESKDVGDDAGDSEECNARAVSNRISKHQKAALERLINNAPTSHKWKVCPGSTKKRWSEIASQLNQIPGARKTWTQWSQTWKDIKKNAKKSQSQLLYHSDKIADNDETVSSDKMCVSSTAKEDASDDDGNEEFFANRRRARNMSTTQKKLLHKLVSSNAILQKYKFDDTKSASANKQVEWTKIAMKLNSVKGPQKTLVQWKRCWSDIQKYYIQRDGTDQLLDADISDVDMSDPGARNPPEHCINSNELTDCTPSATQLNCLVKKIAEHRHSTNIWSSLSNTLNDLGPCVKDCRGWKNVWNDHKNRTQKLVDKNGTASLDNLHRLTYECIKRERNKDDSASDTLNGQQVQLLQRTADQECNAVGSLVAVKLRSMVKEQKLIAEKLISEILFQGQMEMFQYSDEAVKIPGYF